MLLLLTSGSLHGQAAIAAGPTCRPFAEVIKDPVADEIFPDQFTTMPTEPTSLWQFSGFVDKKEVPLKQFKRKATIVVNVASE